MTFTRLAKALLCGSLLVLTAHACGDDSESNRPTPPTTGGPGGIDVGGGTGQGGGTGGAVGPTGAGGLAPVRLGITANPLTLDGATPTPSDVLNAELTAYAAGVGSIALDVPFDDHDDAALTQIEQRVTAYAEREVDVVVTVLVVDGLVSHRPAATVGLAWDHPTTVAALEDLLSDILDRTEANLSVVLVSRRADAYAAANASEAVALTALSSAAIQYLEARAPNLMTGVGVQFLNPPRTELAPLLALGDAVVLSYLPGLGDMAFPVNTNPALALDVMLEMAAVPGGDEARPIVLQSVGFPSEASISASPVVQGQLLDAFFTALQPRRAAFPYVNVHQLHDLDATACDTLLAAQGLDLTDPWGAYMCSTGLRGIDSTAKDAWQRFLEATAAFDGG